MNHSCTSRSKILPALFLLLLFTGHVASALTNGLALTPPMGYNSWYGFGAGMSEPIIETVADIMATNGLLAAGYNYINLDDGWPGYRDTNGVIVADTNKFPSGMKAVADYMHSKGFKFGLYITAGTNTCAGFPGAVNHTVQDANTYASWGVDYLKFEGCNVPIYEVLPRQQIYIVRMQQALAHCGRPIVFSSSVASFENWMPQYINLWRGTGDINNQWSTILSHIDFVAQTPGFAGPGRWNDMDVMPVGNGAYSWVEDTSIFSMWCMEASPLIVLAPGNGQTNILCNAEAIAVDQDPACIQGVCVVTNGDLQVWRKPYGSSNSMTLAVALFNRGTNNTSLTVNWSDLGLPPGVATVRDLWAHAYAGNFTNSYTGVLVPHGVQLLKLVWGQSLPLPAVGTNYLSDLPWLAGYTNIVYLPNGAPLIRDLAGSQTPLTLHGVTFAKGLGMVSYTRVPYFLGHAVSRFQSTIGLDDVAAQFGGVIFRVYVDGVKRFESGVMTTQTPAQTVDLDVTGHNILTLEIVDSATNGINGYGDWADARLIVSPEPTSLSAVTSGNELVVSWNATPGALSYNVKRSTNIGGPYTLITNVTLTSFIDTNVTPDVIAYYYLVSTVTAGGESTNSAPLSATLAAYWNNPGVGVPQNWNAPGSWLNTATFPNRSNLGAILNLALPANQTIALNQPITIGALSIGVTNGSAAYTLAANGGSLTFDNSGNWAELMQISSSQGDTITTPLILQSPLAIDNLSTTPLTISGSITLSTNLPISNNSPGPVNISGTISGPVSLVQNSSGVLTLSGSNTFTGSVGLAQGLLRVGNSSALGNVTATTTVSNGAALDVNGFNLGATPVTASGIGPDGAGAIINNSATTQANALRFVTLNDHTTLGGATRWDIRGATNQVVSGAFSTGGQPFNLTKAGLNWISLADLSVDAALFNIDVQQGVLAFENTTTSMGNPAGTLTVETNSTLALIQTTNSWNKVIILNGDGLTTTISSAGGSNNIIGPVTMNGACLFGMSNGVLTLNGPASGSGSLTKTSSGQLSLARANSFLGNTTLNAGTLALLNSNALAASPTLSLASGTLLDVSALTGGGFVLAPAQILTGSGAVKGNFTVGASARLAPANFPATLTFSNALTFLPGSTCTMKVSHFPAGNDQVRVGGTLTYAGTLVISNLSSLPLAAGDAFQLFSAGTYAGGFANISPQIPGFDLVWDASGLASNGTLRVIVGTTPLFTSSRAHGNVLSISGGGGSTNGSYFVLSSPNLELPIGQWSRIATNHFDAGGNFAFTNLIPTNFTTNFYLLQLP